MMRPPMPIEPDPPREPLVVLVRRWRNGTVTRDLMPASEAHAHRFSVDNGERVTGLWIEHRGNADLFGQSA